MLASCTAERFVALDVHKHYVVVGAVNVGQQVVLSPRRVDLDEFLSWSQQHLHSTDAVVLEAITHGLCNEMYICLEWLSKPIQRSRLFLARNQ